MVILAACVADPLGAPALRSMFEARKEVFVDLLKWDIPVIDDRFEIDQFDDEHAAYIIICDERGAHLGSARLLKSVRPHILDTLFPSLCAAPLPRGPNVLEITRFCLGRRQGRLQRLETRNLLVSALVRYALANGIDTYTGVAEMGWLQQILAFGWICRPLGLPQRIGGRSLGALRIDIASDTPALLAANGIHRPTELEPAPMLEAA
jgi:N-acyl-L-homoserine lactone synthetase